MREINKYSLTVDFRRAARIIATFLIGGMLWAQGSKPHQPPAPPAQPHSQATSQASSQTAANALPPIQLDSSAALHHLNQVISWYRHSTTGVQSVGLPSDAIYQDNTQSLAAQVVRLAFQSAKAETALIAAQQKASGANQPSGGTTEQQNLAQLQAKTSSEIDRLQSQIESLNQQIAKTPSSRRSNLISQRDALQGELELQKALLDAIQKMASFVESNGEITGDSRAALTSWRARFPRFSARQAQVLKSLWRRPRPPNLPWPTQAV